MPHEIIEQRFSLPRFHSHGRQLEQLPKDPESSVPDRTVVKDPAQRYMLDRQARVEDYGVVAFGRDWFDTFFCKDCLNQLGLPRTRSICVQSYELPVVVGTKCRDSYVGSVWIGHASFAGGRVVSSTAQDSSTEFDSGTTSRDSPYHDIGNVRIVYAHGYIRKAHNGSRFQLVLRATLAWLPAKIELSLRILAGWKMHRGKSGLVSLPMQGVFVESLSLQRPRDPISGLRGSLRTAHD